MSPRELLERLEAMGIIDPSVLQKISREIDNPDKSVKTKAMLKYLVKKGHITQAQAVVLLKEIEKPKPVEHDEIKVDPSAEVKKDAYDTDDLTSAVAEEFQKPAPKKPAPDPGATVMDAMAAGDDNDDIVTAPGISEVDVHDALRDEVQAIDLNSPAYGGGMHDPLADPNAAMYGAEAGNGDHPHSVIGFRGKIDKKDQWATKWLYIGFGILGTLIILGVILYIAVYRQTAEDAFKDAMSAFDNGNWGDAIEKLTTFVDKYPKDEKTPTAKVRKVHALLAQTYEAKNWDETIKRAEEKLPELMDDPDELDMSLIRDDLSVILPNTVFAITERAKRQRTRDAMQTQLEFSERANVVVENPSYVTTQARKRAGVADKLDKIKNNILTVRGLIGKEDDYATALVQIKTLSDQMLTDDAFSKYNDLIIKYGDLAARDELQALMKGVSEKERDLVKIIQPTINAVSIEPKSVIESTVVLMSKNGNPVDSLRGEISVILAEGSLYGIDSGTGSVVWRRFVGYQTSIQPQEFDVDSIIACNQQSDEIMRLETGTGKLIWRTSIAEPMLAPSVAPTMVVVTTRSGKVFKLDPADGALQGACQLPQPATSSAFISERNPYIYQAGQYSNLYVLSSVDLTCKDVYYVGHSRGAISIKPLAWSGYLLITINGGSHADVHVLKPSDQGTALALIQVFPKLTSGAISTPLMRFGRWLLVAADNGDMKILELDSTNETTPIRTFAEEKFENRDGQRPFFLTQGSQLWIGGKGIIKYKLKGNLGKFERELILDHDDTFISPMTKLDETLIHVRRRGGSSMVSVSAVDAKTLKEIWETRLGGDLVGPPQVVDGNVHAVSGQGDFFNLDADAIASGYSDKAVKSSTVVNNLLFNHQVELPDNALALFGPKDRKDMVYIDPSGNSKLIRLSPPADQIASEPIVVGQDLLVASSRGQVARINPKTGRMVGSPFQPLVRAGTSVNWPKPVLIGNNVVIARGRTPGDDSTNAFFLLDTSNPSSLTQLAKIDSEATIKSGIVAVQNNAYAVTAGEEGDQLIALDSASNLAEVGKVPLGGGYVSGPWALGPFVLVTIDTGQLVCFDKELVQKWSISLPNEQFAGGPQIAGSRIMLPFRSGKVTYVDPTTGEEISGFDLGQPINHAPVENGSRLYFAGADGTVHILDTANLGTAGQ